MMKLSRSGFELLVLLEKEGGVKLTQKQLADELDVSVGAVNKLLREFTEAGYILAAPGRSMSITAAGLELLEPYRVKRAIILAAGFSERLAPVSLEVPKPLVTVKGVRLVDTLIDALLAAGIEDISIVLGYKAAAFAPLGEKYPMLRFVNNPIYNQAQNIASLFAAKDKIDRCYICDADMYVHNPSIIRKYEYSSCFFGVPVAETDDWCFHVSSQKIRSFGIGGEKCYRAVFITYLNAGDSERLRGDLEQMITSRGGREHHWFDALFADRNRYQIEARSCYAGDVSEVDTMGDLIKLDDSYLGCQL